MSGRQIIIVVGPGRSGTSLLMQILAAQGMKISVPPPTDISNPLGDFEDRDITAAHDAIFSSLKLPPLLPRTLTRVDQRRLTPHKATLQDIVRRNLPEDGLWGFKDPRASTLIPFWNQVLQEMDIAPRYVLCLRHPTAVVESMRRHFARDTEVSEYLWLMRAIEPLITNPNGIFIVHYEDWFTDEVKRTRLATSLMKFTGFPVEGLKESLASVIKSPLNRNPDTGTIANPHLRKLYRALRKSKSNGKPPIAAVKLALEIKPVIEQYVTAARDTYAREVAAQAREASRLAEQLAAQAREASRLAEELAAQEARSTARLAALSDAHAKEAAGLAEELARQNAEIAALSGSHAEEAARLGTQLAEQQARAAALADAHAAEVSRLRQQLAEQEAGSKTEIATLSDQHEKELRRLTDQLDQRTAQLTALTSEHARLGGELAQWKVELEAQAAALRETAELRQYLQELTEQHRWQTIELKQSAVEVERLSLKAASLASAEEALRAPRSQKPDSPAPVVATARAAATAGVAIAGPPTARNRWRLGRLLPVSGWRLKGLAPIKWLRQSPVRS